MINDLQNHIEAVEAGSYAGIRETRKELAEYEAIKQALSLHNVVHRRELLLAAICGYNKYNTQKVIKAVDDWLKEWDSK